ncbi:MAG: alpha/beta fold hydrolase [Planctomycetales bacterium]
MTRIPLFPQASFQAHPLVRGGHAQTLAGVYLPGKLTPYKATPHRVTLPDGDVLIVHEDSPLKTTTSLNGSAPWGVILLHGLCGSHLSPYIIRIAHKLNALGVRTWRVDLRGCGAGVGLARLPYHAGRSEDLRTVIQFVTEQNPDIRLCPIGFSLGGNITLKYLGEADQHPLPSNVVAGMAVNPPIDLERCVSGLTSPLQRQYDRYFVKLLMLQLRQMPDGLPLEIRRTPPKGLFEFDDRYTAPVAGFGTAHNYYQQSSSKPRLKAIQRPTLILTADDDPLVDCRVFDDAEASQFVQIFRVHSGGHLGYLSTRPPAGDHLTTDRRWMDRQVVDWVRHLQNHLD